MNLNKHTKVITVLAITIATFVISTIVLAILLASKTSEKKPEICTTKACINAANMILENMDPNIDPCVDFNQFACGSFIKNQRIPDDQSKFDVFDVLRNKLAFSVSDILSEPIDSNDINATLNAKKLYKSCVNEESIENDGEFKLLDFVNKTFDGWPILDERLWNEATFDPIKILITSRFYSLKQIVDVYITVNPKDPKSSVLRVRQPGWFFNKQYYGDEETMDAYKEFMFNFIRYLNSTYNDTALRENLNQILEIEKKLAEFTLNEDQRRASIYKNTTIKDLSRDIPWFDWKHYIINGMFKNIENVTVYENETILVDDWDYLVNATKLYDNYSKTRKRDLKNFFVWVFVKDRTFVLPRKYKDIRLDFDKVYRGTNSIQSRSITCSNFVLDRMDFAAGRLYVSKYFNNQSRDAAISMIDYIKKEFKELLRNSEWMDDTSKEKALAKADYIESKIGYPDFIYNDTFMAEKYKEYQFTENDFSTNTIRLTNLIVANDLKSFRTERNRTNWISGPAVVNAFYSATLNQICFPAGILQAPFYDAQTPNYLNYGGIGSVIGHEITHGFDDRGRLYDKDGVFFPDDASGLWTNMTIQNYKAKAKCIIDQYGGYLVEQINMTLNGFQTQGENIADNGGIKQAFYAYQKWLKTNPKEPLLPGLNYSQNQLFFINYAQVWCAKFRDQSLLQRILTGVHSPGEFRILGPTSNFKEFGNSFNCKAGTRNNPEAKCAVW